MMLLYRWFLFGALIPAATVFAQGRLVVLVDQGRPAATIVAPADGAAAYAASEIQRCVREMSGVLLPIAPESKTPRIVVRVAAGAARDDGYRLTARDGEVIIEAGMPRGCVHGAYGLLEQLGCRFYGPVPFGFVLPKQATLSIPDSLNVKREPSFRHRYVPGSSLIPDMFPTGGTPQEHLQWGYSHTRVTANADEIARLSQMGFAQYRFVHLWPELLAKRFSADGRAPVKADFAGHQDWLPDDGKGNRRATGQTLCFSNADALAWFAENAADCVLASYRSADLVSIWPPDAGSMQLCRCAACVARGLNATDWYLLTQNAIRSRLTEKGWTGRLGWISYHGTEPVPSKTPLVDGGANMDFLYAPRPRGGTMHGPFTADHPVNRKYRDNLKSWQDWLKGQNYAGTRTVFEYYYDLVLLGPSTQGRAFLIPKHAVMQEDMRFYRAQGFEGFFDCCPPFATWWPDPLNRWLFDRLLWDVDLDVPAARKGFFTNYYGPAAGPAREVREGIEKIMFEPPTEAAVEGIQRLKEPLDKLTSDNPILSIRLQALRQWVDYCALCKRSELHEKVAPDAQKGAAAEKAIQELFRANRAFLLEHRFMAARDVGFLEGIARGRSQRFPAR